MLKLKFTTLVAAGTFMALAGAAVAQPTPNAAEPDAADPKWNVCAQRLRTAVFNQKCY